MTQPSRRLTAALAAGLLVAALVDVTLPAASNADDDNTLTVVGTSDVFDSGLFDVSNPNSLIPIIKAQTGITVNYVSKGTGAAITYAEGGSASALIVHAASLENQFVADGFSLEPFGRSIFWGDYVMAGPAGGSDPAGVLSGGDHDIVTAYEKIAAAGAEKKAEFISRGGTPGTTVQEHAIWALANPAKVTMCDVSAANGGGRSPSTTTGACPPTITYPSWYHVTGLTQGPNITLADSCNGFDSKACYVFTDRGTFNYLQTTNKATSLQVMTRNNAPASRGGQKALINAFHAYAINPSAPFAGGSPATTLAPTTAVRFLNWLTSPAGQKAVGGYLSAFTPFIPAASPSFTLTSPLPASLTGSTPLHITGSVRNPVPGYPTLEGVTVHLQGVPFATPSAAPATLTSAVTDDLGNFTLNYTPSFGMTYSFATDPITKVENSDLSPIFADQFAAGSQTIGQVATQGVLKVGRRTTKGHHVTVKGALNPQVAGFNGRVLLYRAHPGKKLRPVGAKLLLPGATRFTSRFYFPSGTWKYRVVYSNPGRITSKASSVYRVRIR